MAKQKKPLSSYQKGVIKRYYENKEDLAHQNISELVSELYLETSEKKKDGLWERVEKALKHTGASDKQIKKLIADKDVEGVAKFATDSY